MPAEVTTVLGPVSADQLGVVLPHEHLFSDTRAYYQPPAGAEARAIGEGPVEMRRLGLLRRNLFAIRENLLLAEMDTAVEESMAFATLGGGTIVDLTPVDVGRDPAALMALARRTGLNVVMGCGHYIQAVHPPGIAAEPVESITERLLLEIAHGVGATGIRPGIIGEIGTWSPIHPDERKVLVAAAAAQRATGLALSVHLHIAARSGHEVLDILEQAGVDLARVVLGHLDIAFGHLDSSTDEVLDYHRSLARRGCYLEYDTVGVEGFAPASPVTPPFWTVTDLTRARAVATLVDEGFGGQLLLSHDVFTRSQLLRYGGFGYGHILRDFQHRLAEVGLGAAELQRILVDNPRRMLTPTP